MLQDIRKGPNNTKKKTIIPEKLGCGSNNGWRGFHLEVGCVTSWRCAAARPSEAEEWWGLNGVKLKAVNHA